MQTCNKVGAPVGVEMSFRFVQQKQAMSILEQQTKAEPMQQLVLPIGKSFKQYRRVSLRLRNPKMFKSHDPYIRSQYRDSFADIETARLIKVCF